MERKSTGQAPAAPRLRQAYAALACLSAACAIPAAAQEASGAQARASVVLPLSLSKEKDLDFGEIGVNSAGTVMMTPSADPICTVVGGLVKFGVCQPAVFEGYGETGRTVRIKIPGAKGITLTGPGGATMQIDKVQTDGNGTLGPPTTGNETSNGFRRHRIVSADGAFEFRLAGTLNVAAAQPLGLYTATFQIEIAYE